MKYVQNVLLQGFWKRKVWDIIPIAPREQEH